MKTNLGIQMDTLERVCNLVDNRLRSQVGKGFEYIRRFDCDDLEVMGTKIKI